MTKSQLNKTNFAKTLVTIHPNMQYIYKYSMLSGNLWKHFQVQYILCTGFFFM